MIKIRHLGYYSLAGGLLTLLLQTVASIAQKDFAWKRWVVKDFFDTGQLSWIDSISLLNLNVMLNQIVNLPLYLFFFGMTVLFALLSVVTRD